MTHTPTLKQLRYLVALAEHKHFGRAAQACFVSQSAFSIAIKELETLLNVQLVDRTNRRVTITRIGQDIVVQARLVLQDTEGLMDLARSGREPLAGRLNLGVIPTIAPFLLPKVMPALRSAFPRLELYLKEDVTERIHGALLTGELDLILLALPFELRNVETMALFRDAFRLAVHEETALLDPTHYRVSSLPSESVLLLEDGHCLRHQAISACRIRDTAKLSRFKATSLLTLVQMVDSDLGVTYLPEMAEDSALLRGTHIHTYPLREDSYRTIALAWRKGSARAEAFQTLGAVIRDHR